MIEINVIENIIFGIIQLGLYCPCPNFFEDMLSAHHLSAHLVITEVIQ